jgi:acyl-CoA thioester hydrolase
MEFYNDFRVNLKTTMVHKFNFRIYYEDTDSGGVVYYANYLKFAERARTELLREKGIHQSVLALEAGILFVVRSANLELFSPARLDEMIEVSSQISKISGASINIIQHINTADRAVAQIMVKVACINKNFKPVRLPDDIKIRLYQSVV